MENNPKGQHSPAREKKQEAKGFPHLKPRVRNRPPHRHMACIPEALLFTDSCTGISFKLLPVSQLFFI